MRAVLDAEQSASRDRALQRFVGLDPLPAAVRATYGDALANLVVGEELTALGPRWDILHDVPVGEGRHVDHLILGPSGIFALRAVRATAGELVVDGDQLACGDRVDDLGRLRQDAGRIAALLAAAGTPVEVRPAIVVVGEVRYVVRLPARSIQIVALSQLERWLGSMRPVLSGEEVAGLSDLIDRSEHWPAADPPDRDLLPRFTELRERVRAASRRRSLWAAIGFAAGFVVLWGAIAVLAAAVLTA